VSAIKRVKVVKDINLDSRLRPVTPLSYISYRTAGICFREVYRPEFQTGILPTQSFPRFRKAVLTSQMRFAVPEQKMKWQITTTNARNTKNDIPKNITLRSSSIGGFVSRDAVKSLSTTSIASDYFLAFSNNF
jgi:hypothetical protein